MGLSIMLFLVGCSKDNVVDPVNTPTTSNSDVGSLAKKYFAIKMDAVDAADSLKTRFPAVAARDIVDVSYQAGYTPEDLIRMLNLSFQKNPKETERILLSILSNYTSVQLAELIIQGYKDFLLNHPDELFYLINKFPDLKDKIRILGEDFHQSFEQMFALLNNDSTAVSIVDMVDASQAHFHFDQKTILQILMHLNISPEKIALVLKHSFHMEMKDVAKALKDLGLNLKDIYKALKGNWDFKSFKTMDLVNMLINLGFDKTDVYRLFGLCH